MHKDARTTRYSADRQNLIAGIQIGENQMLLAGPDYLLANTWLVQRLIPSILPNHSESALNESLIRLDASQLD